MAFIADTFFLEGISCYDKQRAQLITLIYCLKYSFKRLVLMQKMHVKEIILLFRKCALIKTAADIHICCLFDS